MSQEEHREGGQCERTWYVPQMERPRKTTGDEEKEKWPGKGTGHGNHCNLPKKSELL